MFLSCFTEHRRALSLNLTEQILSLKTNILKMSHILIVVNMMSLGKTAVSAIKYQLSNKKCCVIKPILKVKQYGKTYYFIHCHYFIWQLSFVTYRRLSPAHMGSRLSVVRQYDNHYAFCCDKHVASSNTSSPHTAIWCCLFKFPLSSRFLKVIE